MPPAFPPRRSSELLKEEARREAERHAYQESIFNDLWRTLPRGEQTSAIPAAAAERQALLHLPQENILYFLEKTAPRLDAWQREVLRITRVRSEEHTSELQSLMRISYAVFCLKKKNNNITSNEKTKE